MYYVHGYKTFVLERYDFRMNCLGVQYSKLQKFLSTKVSQNFTKWLFLGGATSILDLSLFISFYHFSHNIYLSNLGSGIIAVIFNFNVNYFLVFDTNSSYLNSVKKYILSFIFERSLNTLIVTLIMKLFISPAFSKILSSLIQSPLSYMLNKKFVYRAI